MERNIRHVAETILSPQTMSSLPLSHSINLFSEEMIAGHRHDGRMSSVRRFFCLFVTFDLLFTSLMWLICIVMHGETLLVIFDREILHYNIKSSFFDVVMVALARFLLLILFYAIFYINNWSIIALTTAGSSTFLIGKVFMFNWPNATAPVYQVFLIISSFTLSWGEAWFLDFRVLPQEEQAKRLLQAITGPHTSSERTPLLHSRLGSQTHGESTGAYFSPIDTPSTSPRFRRPHEEVILTQEKIDEYKRVADEGMYQAFTVTCSNGWTLEKKSKNDVVESKITDKYGKVYRFSGIVDCPPKFLFEEFRDNLTKLPEWNPTILKNELIKEIGTGYDLSYQVTAGGGGGVIAPRDFVILRRCAGVDGNGSVSDNEPYAYICSGISVEVPGYPPVKDMVRGENKVGCWLMRPVQVKSSAGNVETRTNFQWLMCCDLKGKVPKWVLDKAFATVMLDYIVHVRKFVAIAKQEGRF